MCVVFTSGSSEIGPYRPPVSARNCSVIGPASAWPRCVARSASTFSISTRRRRAACSVSSRSSSSARVSFRHEVAPECPHIAVLEIQRAGRAARAKDPLKSFDDARLLWSLCRALTRKSSLTRTQALLIRADLTIACTSWNGEPDQRRRENVCRIPAIVKSLKAHLKMAIVLRQRQCLIDGRRQFSCPASRRIRWRLSVADRPFHSDSEQPAQVREHRIEMRGVASARRLLAFNYANAAGQHRPYREIRWVMAQLHCAPALVCLRFGLTQDLSDVGRNLVLQVRHTVSLVRRSAKLPSKPFDSEGFGE